MNRLAAAVVTLSCVLAPLAAHAQSLMRGGSLPPELAQRVGISAEQQKKLQQLTFEANEQLISLQADVKRARLELKRQLDATTPDQKAVFAQADKVTRAQGEVKKNRLGLLLRIREVVGPDAWQKLKAERQQRRHERGERGMKMKRRWMGAADPMPGTNADPMMANAPSPEDDDGEFDAPEMGAP